MNSLKRKVLGVLVAGSSLLLLAPAPSALASGDNPVETQPCPPGYYGAELYVQTPSGDRQYIACVWVG